MQKKLVDAASLLFITQPPYSGGVGGRERERERERETERERDIHTYNYTYVQVHRNIHK